MVRAMMDLQREKELLYRAKRGDDSAFDELVRENERLVYALCLQRLGHQQDAQDVCQDTFLKAWLSLKKFREDSRFSVWLYRIAANACTDFLRKRKTPVLSLNTEDADANPAELLIPDERFSPETLYERKEQLQELSEAMHRLSPVYQEALTLRELGGQSYEEISQTLSLDIGTVKSRIYRARKKLLELLNTDGNFPEKSASKDRKGGGKR